MKKAQIEDFAASSKALEKYSIGNMPALEPRTPHGEAMTTTGQPSTYSPTRPSVKTNDTGESERGGLRRHSYEVFGDQVMALNRLAHEDKMSGGKGSMSEMVREAIDAFIKQRTSTRVGE